MNGLRVDVEATIVANQAAVQDQFSATPEWGVAVLEDGRLSDDINAGQRFEAASINKLAIAYAAERQGLSPQTELTLEPCDIREGNGILRYFPLGFSLAMGDVRQLSLSISDNTAAAMLVRAIGGPHEVNNVLESDPALIYTRLEPQTAHDTEATARYNYGITTALESARLHRQLMGQSIDWQALAHGNFVQGARLGLGDRPEQFAFPAARLLLAAKLVDRAPGNMHLPQAVYKRLVGAQMRTPHSDFPNKEGTYGGNLHETIQIGNLTLAVMSSGHPEAATVLARRVQTNLGSIVYRYATAV